VSQLMTEEGREFQVENWSKHVTPV